MKSKASAPGKVILFGEHFVVYGTRAVLCAIDRRATVLASTTPEKIIKIRSDMGSVLAGTGDDPASVNPALLPLFHLARNHTSGEGGGIDISVESDIPPGAGLGSSSAVCVAGAAAVAGLSGIGDRDHILRLAVDAERTAQPDSSGADCAACTHGGMITYSSGLGPSPAYCAPGPVLVVADSESSHSTGSVVAGVRRFRKQNVEEFAKLCCFVDALVGNALEHARTGNLRGLGACMAENQRALERIGVSTSRLDEMVAVAGKTSFGAKITGAGGGGCTVSLDSARSAPRTVDGLRKCGIRCFTTGMDCAGLSVG